MKVDMSAKAVTARLKLTGNKKPIKMDHEYAGLPSVFRNRSLWKTGRSVGTVPETEMNHTVIESKQLC